MEPIAYHNSWENRYRNPFGAIPIEGIVRLGLHVAPAALSPRVYLRLWHNGKEDILAMKAENPTEDGTFFVLTLPTAEISGLFWYYFIIEADGTTFYYGAKEGRTGGEGILSREKPASFQITVYRPWEIPAWYRKGIVYQIFVDRFYRGGENPIVTPPPSQGPKRILHLDWNDHPFYLKDEKGDITHWDFFGGNLEGIIEKLPYLKSLGVTALYLNPIFEAASNHKYDTGDYHRIDPGYGDEDTFQRLTKTGAGLGIHILLDGVFSHTGADSRYFNRYGNYPGKGAFQSQDSPYFPWYRFKTHPDGYESWWNVKDLPNVEEENESYRNFIFGPGDSVLNHWLGSGAKGWRLDVADELPEHFIKDFRMRLKEQDKDAVLIGEVWEDASHKVSYGQVRQYLLGESLDGTMHYPLRQCWLDFILNRTDGKTTSEHLLSLWENYPPPAIAGAMNLIGSHDTERILTLLGKDEGEEITRRRFALLVLLQMTFPGVPAIYYGDEAGLTGGKDPENRGAYPWNREDQEILSWYRRMTKLRREYELLSEGEIEFLPPSGDLLAFRRHRDEEEIYVLINASIEETAPFPPLSGRKLDLLTGRIYKGEEGFSLPPLSALVLYSLKEEPHWEKSAGLLMPVSALPGADGCGDLGKPAYDFVDFLSHCGQKIWQILPLNPLGTGFSPYDSPGAFGMDPIFLSMEGMDDLLTTKEIAQARTHTKTETTDYEQATANKESLWRKAFSRFRDEEEYHNFVAANDFWLHDFCLYRALKKYFRQTPWQEWPKAIARREERAMEHYRSALKDEILYQRFLQYSVHRQWHKLRAYAQEKGIAILGDLPLYVASDSADTWTHRRLFQLDEQGYPIQVAGVPPDDFSATGQNWANPLYSWDEMAKDDFLWWRQRIAHALVTADHLRIDHFRGLEAYWAIPKDTGANEGEWIKGPGLRFFAALKRHFPALPLIAEDLGHLTPEMENLKQINNLLGMKIHQFSATEMNGKENNIYYSGTHDNETLVGWYQRNHPASNAKEAETTCRAIMEDLYRKDVPWVILPLQDILGLGNEARLNIPGTSIGNWRWRLDGGLLNEQVAAWLREITIATGRNKKIDPSPL